MQTREDIQEFLMIMTGTIIPMAMLIDELDKRDLISKAEMADMLSEAAEHANENPPPSLVGAIRLDTRMMDALAFLLRAEAPSSPGGWVPRVIEGGLGSGEVGDERD